MSEHGERPDALRAALRASRTREAQLRQVVDLVPDYIFANDRDGIVLLSNEAHARAYGASPEAIVGANYVELDPDREQAQGLLELDREVIASGEPARLPELEVVDARGRELTVDLRLIPYVEAQTGKDAVLGVRRGDASR